MAFEAVNEQEFRERLLGWRLAYGFTRARLGRVTGISESTLTRIEKGGKHGGLPERGLRMDVYNRLVEVMAIEPRSGWWDREKTRLFYYCRGRHEAVLFRAVLDTWLFCGRYRRHPEMSVVEAQGKKTVLYESLFPGAAAVETGWLLRMPSEYGYMLVEAGKQGAFEATMLVLDGGKN